MSNYILFGFCCQILFQSLMIHVIDANKFNMFKSYQNAKVKPKQYTKNPPKSRPLSEYLTNHQKGMLKRRYGQDVPGAMFDEKWSGFDLKENSNPLVKRRLRSNMSPLTIDIDVPYTWNTFVFSFLTLILVLATLVYRLLLMKS